MLYDVLIIGAGPAGLTAAIYFGRANLKVAIIEKSAPGGKIITTSVIENYPGFLRVSGTTLALAMLEQVKAFDIPFIYDEVVDISKEKQEFVVKLGSDTVRSKRVLVASGTSNRSLGVNKESLFMGHGISYCAVCDGMLYKNEEVSVIGGGNSAFEESLYLAKICKKVNLIHRSENYRADKVLIDKVKKTKNIQMYPNTIVEGFNGDFNLESISIKNTKPQIIKSKAAFIYIGYLPATSFLANLQVLDDFGFMIVNNEYESTIKGLYGAGDCINHPVKQIGTAVGDATTVANIIIRSF